MIMKVSKSFSECANQKLLHVIAFEFLTSQRVDSITSGITKYFRENYSVVCRSYLRPTTSREKEPYSIFWINILNYRLALGSFLFSRQ